MNVLNEYRTVMHLISNRASIARYGDGELRICVGRNAKLQHYHPELSQKLKSILKSRLEKLLVAVPRIFDRDVWPTEQKAVFWNTYSKDKKYLSLYDRNLVYGSAFITRPDSVGKEIYRDSYFDLMKVLWQGRRVLLLQGPDGSFAKSDGLFSTCSRLDIIYGPGKDAFNDYDSLLKKCLKETKPWEEEEIIVLSLGPTATVLASDLCMYGRQALDLGHLAMFYNKLRKGGNVNDKTA